METQKCLPFIHRLCNLIPGVLIQQGVIALDNYDLGFRRYLVIILDRILPRMIKTWGLDKDFRLSASRHRESVLDSTLVLGAR